MLPGALLLLMLLLMLLLLLLRAGLLRARLLLLEWLSRCPGSMLVCLAYAALGSWCRTRTGGRAQCASLRSCRSAFCCPEAAGLPRITASITYHPPLSAQWNGLGCICPDRRVAA